MGAALEGAIASTRLTTDAMAGVASMVTSTLNRATQERQIQSNIMEGMIRSAQDAKQMEIDSFFKGKELELRGQQLEIESKYRNAQLGIDNSRLAVSNRQADIEERKVAYLENKQVEADKYKPYLSGLTNQANRLKDEITQKAKAYKSEEETLKLQLFGRPKSGDSPEVKGMTRFQRLQDEKSSTGKTARLKELQTNLYKDLEDKSIRLGSIEGEISNVTTGGTPGAVLPLPKGFSFDRSDDPFSTSKNTRDVSGDGMPSGRGSIDLSLFGGMSDDEKAATVLGLEELDRMEGQLPQDTYQNDISPEQEESIKNQQDQEYIAYIFDPETPINEVKEFQQHLSPNGKVQLNDNKNTYATGILTDYGVSKSYNASNDYKNEDKANEHLAEMFIRAGGSSVEYQLLRRDAETNLIQFRAQATKEINEAKGDMSNIDSLVASKYNEWVDKRLVQAKEADKRTLDSDIATGNQIGANGTLPGYKSLAKPESDEEVDKSLDMMLKKYIVSADPHIASNKNKEEDALIDEFSKEFIKQENPNSFKRLFADTALQNPTLMYAVLGNDVKDYTGNSEPTQEDINRINAQNANNFISKVKTLSLVDAFTAWKNTKDKFKIKK